MSRPRTIHLILGTALLGACFTAAYAQEPKPGSDEALDGLIEKLAEPDPAPARSEAKQAENPKPSKPGGETGDGKAGTSAKEGGKSSGGEIAPQDEELDSLLEKLGESKDEPEAADSRKPPTPGGGADEADRSKSPAPDKKGADSLSRKDRELDERLEELAGRRRKKKSDSSDEGSGPVSEIVKQMREVEQRLGKPDPGEETRRKQKQIVKQIDEMIQQARQSGSSSSSRLKIQQARQSGSKPGSMQPGGQTGSNAGGAPLAKPARPNNPRSLAGGKDVWGHLPPELRQEMENSFKEEALPGKIELIKRYYLSVAKDKPARQE